MLTPLPGVPALRNLGGLGLFHCVPSWALDSREARVKRQIGDREPGTGEEGKPHSHAECLRLSILRSF